jgi:hypothetical protein
MEKSFKQKKELQELIIEEHEKTIKKTEQRIEIYIKS